MCGDTSCQSNPFPMDFIIWSQKHYEVRIIHGNYKYNMGGDESGQSNPFL